MQIPAVESRPAVRTGSHMQDGVNAAGDLRKEGVSGEGTLGCTPPGAVSRLQTVWGEEGGKSRDGVSKVETQA